MRSETRISWMALVAIGVILLVIQLLIVLWFPLGLMITLPTALVALFAAFRTFRTHATVDDTGVSIGAPNAPSFLLPYSEMASCALVESWNPRLHLARRTVDGRRIYHLTESHPIEIVMRDGRRVLFSISAPAEACDYIRTRMGG